MSTQPTNARTPYGSREHTIFTWRAGEPLSEEQYLEQFKARFWAKVDKTPGQGPKGKCWTWTGSRKSGKRVTTFDYGQLTFKWPDGKRGIIHAHVAAYYITTGDLPRNGSATHICHSCDNPPCVNPGHLWKGNARRNGYDARSKGRMKVAAPETRQHQIRVRFTPEQLQQIRKARKAKGATVYDIGFLLETHFTSVHKFEVGERPTLPIEKAHALVSYLGVDIDVTKCEVYEHGWVGAKCGPKPTHLGLGIDKIKPTLPHQIQKQPLVWSRLPSPRLTHYRADLIRRALPKDKSLGAVAAEIGVTAYHLRLVACGFRVYTDLLIKVAAFCGLTPAELFSVPDQQAVAA